MNRGNYKNQNQNKNLKKKADKTEILLENNITENNQIFLLKYQDNFKIILG